MWELKKQELL